jgi:hypothetical protein
MQRHGARWLGPFAVVIAMLMRTRVKLYDWLAKTYPTFTLPRYVDLGYGGTVPR